MELPHPLLSAHQLSRLQGMPAYWAWVQAAMQLASPVVKSRKLLVSRMMSACRVQGFVSGVLSPGCMEASGQQAC